MSNFAYYIGVDHREPEALRVTESSVRAYASKPVTIRHLEHINLRQRGFFNRPWRICEDGAYQDERDGRPFSVQFSHTRFLTPAVALADGVTDWALFTDCDWLWLDDIQRLLKEADPSKTVMVVPHNFEPRGTAKMDGQRQSRYHRKMWSAMMLWNLKSKKLPTPEMVNSQPGSYLHAFGWLDDSDIGFLSEAWHWVPNYSPTTDVGVQAEANHRPLPINAVHFTYGPPVPGMVDREPTPFDEFWTNELRGAYTDAR